VFAESKSCVLVTYLSLRKVPIVELVPSSMCYCARRIPGRSQKQARSQKASQKPSGETLIGRFSTGKRAVLSAIPTVHPSKPPEGFLFRFSGPGGLGCLACGGMENCKTGIKPHLVIPGRTPHP